VAPVVRKYAVQIVRQRVAVVKARAAVTPTALIVLAAAAGAYAYFVDRRTVSDADRAARGRDVFPSLRVDDVDRVELEHGRDVFTLQREVDAGSEVPSGWLLTLKRREKAEMADTAAVDMLLREMEFATRIRQIPDGANLARVALDMPRVRGRVRAGALQYRFALGADAPRPDGAAYMSVDGEGTFVVNRSLRAQLLRGADAYRNRTVVALGPSEIGRIEVHRPDGQGFTLERKGRSVRIAGVSLRASRSAADHIFAALVDARADSFLDEAAAKQATETPITVSVAAGDEGQVHELRVGGACPGDADKVVVLRTLPSVMAACTARTLVEALGATQESLVDASALWARADEVEQIRLETVGSAGPLVELARKAGGWHERAPQERDLDGEESDSANSLAAALAGARAVETPRAEPGEKLIAVARASIVVDRDSQKEVIEVASPSGDGTVLARRDEDGAVLRFSRECARHFVPHPVALRPSTLWRAPFDAGSVIAVDDACTPLPMHLTLSGGNWVMRTPRGFAADPPAIADLTRAVSHAKAVAWVSENDDGSFGFDRASSCAVTLSLADEAESGPHRISVAFGADTEGGVFAHTQDDPAVFVAPQYLRDLAAHLQSRDASALGDAW
jgi:hypothetical protein